MANYATTEKTRHTLIMTAGELFAEHGIKAVTTRMIAQESGENIGTIHYHFGGKSGLLNAVVEYVIAGWKDDPLGKIFEEQQELLETRAGQALLIKQLINTQADIIFAHGSNWWCGTLIYQILQRDTEVTEKVINELIALETRVFVGLYQKIVKGASFDEAYAWMLTVIAPFVLLTTSPLVTTKMRGVNSLDDEFIKRVRQNTIKNTLSGLGLENVNDIKHEKSRK